MKTILQSTEEMKNNYDNLSISELMECYLKFNKKTDFVFADGRLLQIEVR